MQRCQFGGLEIIGEFTPRVFGDKDLTGLGCGTESRCHVHRVSYHRVAHGLGGSDVACHEFACVDADAYVNGRLSARGPGLVVTGQNGQHIHGSVHRTKGIILMGDGGPPDHHDHIAHEFIHRSFVAKNRLHH